MVSNTTKVHVHEYPTDRLGNDKSGREVMKLFKIFSIISKIFKMIFLILKFYCYDLF